MRRIPEVNTKMGHIHLESPLLIIIVGSYVNACMYVSEAGTSSTSVGDDNEEADHDIFSADTEDSPTSRSSTRQDDQQAFDDQADIADADKTPED